MSNKSIQAGDNIKANLSSWDFGGETAHKFDDHITKSVPGYEEGQELIAIYSNFFINLTPGLIYDLGCSTGSLLEKIESKYPHKEITYKGLDIVPEMIDIAKNRHYIDPQRFQFECNDILEVEFQEASIISSYYTLQFIRPSVRQTIVNKIYKALSWGGAFFVFEKTRGPDGRFQDMNTHVYNEYKLKMGYKPEEIFAKSRSLVGVLEPFSDKGNYEMFERAGFKDIEYIYSNICFKGWICIK
tara:strand:+ start:2651 stop:3379 length:729 start_codon:yes stop_codon:yes gene_type:complete